MATAVEVFAERTVRFVRRVPRNDRTDDLRLYAGKYYLQIRIVTSQLHVLRLVRLRD